MITEIPAASFDPQNLTPGKHYFRLSFDDRVKDHGYIPVNVLKGHKEGPTLLILAAVHGDEYEGVQTVIQLLRKLTVQDIRGTLLLVPVANVSSYFHGSRTSVIDGGNLARAFPGKKDGSYTERLAWHLNEALLDRSDFLLDLHSGGSHYAIPAMVGYHHRLEDGAPCQSWQAAENFGMPVIWGHEHVPPGRTVSAATEKNIPWLYTEGYGGKRVRAEEQQLYEAGALRLMHFLNMLCSPDKWIDKEVSPIHHRLLGDGNLDKGATAECNGFFIPEVSLLDQVAEGDLIGRIVDWVGQDLQLIHAETDGFVMRLRATPLTNKGDGLYTLASKQPTVMK